MRRSDTALEVGRQVGLIVGDMKLSNNCPVADGTPHFTLSIYIIINY